MPDFDAIAARYIDVWNDHDAASRRASVAALWTADGRYVDPLTDAQGSVAIDAAIAATHEQFPDLVFRLAGAVDGHHQQCRFAWELGPSDGAAPIAGFDVAQIAADGKLQTVLGFLDRLPT